MDASSQASALHCTALPCPAPTSCSSRTRGFSTPRADAGSLCGCRWGGGVLAHPGAVRLGVATRPRRHVHRVGLQGRPRRGTPGQRSQRAGPITRSMACPEDSMPVGRRRSPRTVSGRWPPHHDVRPGALGAGPTRSLGPVDPRRPFGPGGHASFLWVERSFQNRTLVPPLGSRHNRRRRAARLSVRAESGLASGWAWVIAPGWPDAPGCENRQPTRAVMAFLIAPGSLGLRGAVGRISSIRAPISESALRPRASRTFGNQTSSSSSIWCSTLSMRTVVFAVNRSSSRAVSPSGAPREPANLWQQGWSDCGPDGPCLAGGGGRPPRRRSDHVGGLTCRHRP